MSIKSAFVMFLCLGLLGLSGCENKTESGVKKPAAGDAAQDGHDHGDHKHPETLAEAVTQLEEYKTTIKTAFEGGKPEDAHGALHDIGHLLESIPGLAAKNAEGDADAVKAAVEDLFDAFGALDETMHGGEDIKYETVAEKIDAAVAVIKGQVK